MNGVAVILLAAGLSRRMGCCKQLLPVGNMTVIDRCIGTLKAGGVEQIVTVVSPEGAEVAGVARRQGARIAVNEEPDGDMASSIRAGLSALPVDTVSALVTLCDYPLVLPETVQALVAAGRAAPEKIAVPTHDGRKGHPLLVPRSILDELVPGVILRDLLRRDPDRLWPVAVDDPGVLIDMDTPEAYFEVCRLAELLDAKRQLDAVRGEPCDQGKP